ncbi:hypothetical protein ACQUQU_10175 [Thalassolituus sp. LLYu03]|uniref:hypothetical protein n=1 Tax=Thalassolituus sp. LLYu03 TaxID=3421656 RepID=UPI003D295422
MKTMKIIKYVAIGMALLISGMYGWYLMATEINRHSDLAATVIIEDTLSSSAAYDLEQLRKIELSIRENELETASGLIKTLIENKEWQLKACVTKQCEILGYDRIE